MELCRLPALLLLTPLASLLPTAPPNSYCVEPDFLELAALASEGQCAAVFGRLSDSWPVPACGALAGWLAGWLARRWGVLMCAPAPPAAFATTQSPLPPAA